MRFLEISEEEFGGFVRGAACDNFMQSVEMRRRYLTNGTESYLVGLANDGGSLVAGALVAASGRKIAGKKVFKIAGGPVMDYDGDAAGEVLREFVRGLAKFLRAKDGMAVRMSPDVVAVTRDSDARVIEGPEHKKLAEDFHKLGFKYLGEYEQAKWTYVVPVQGKSLDELWLNIRKSHRQRIKKAEKAGVTLRELGVDELGVFERLEEEAARRHGFAGPSVKYYKEMKEAFGEGVKFMLCEAPELGENDEPTGVMKPAAVGMFVLYGREILCVYSGTASKFSRSGAAHLLRWEMIKRAAEGGFERYNFYGTHPLPDDGVYEFKRGFGGQAEELVGTFILPLTAVGRLYCAKLKAREYGKLQ